MKEDFQLLDVAEIEFDTENPRIKKALEKYGDRINAERINFALRSSSDDTSSSSTFSRLRDSIRANGRITQPITVVILNDAKICIDGNTRLAIYKEFLKENTEGDWRTIPALVLREAKTRDIETIRVSAHLVGARPWPAYEKARYLHYLYHTELMDHSDMIALCGGNKKDIERDIEAYEDMNTYYRDLVDDTAFHIDRFSGFVELQSKGIKEAVFEAGYELSDFGEWIRDGKIRRLRDVRDLPRVLRNEDATELFVNGGVGSIEEAIKHLDQIAWASTPRNASKLTLQNAPIELIAHTLTARIINMPFSELQSLGADEKGTEILNVLEDLNERLGELLGHVRK